METEFDRKLERTVIATVSVILVFAALHYFDHPCQGLPGSLAFCASIGAFMWTFGPFVLQVVWDSVVLELICDIFTFGWFF